MPRRDRFADAVYPLPAALVAAAPDGMLTVKFAAKEKSRIASIFDVRLVKLDSNSAIAR